MKLRNFLSWVWDNGGFAILGLILAYGTVKLVKADGYGRSPYYYSYQTGCYNAYYNECSFHENERQKEACFNRGLDSCEAQAKQFADWIVNASE